MQNDTKLSNPIVQIVHILYRENNNILKLFYLPEQPEWQTGIYVLLCLAVSYQEFEKKKKSSFIFSFLSLETDRMRDVKKWREQHKTMGFFVLQSFIKFHSMASSQSVYGV